jgi:hypothetical protein
MGFGFVGFDIGLHVAKALRGGQPGEADNRQRLLGWGFFAAAAVSDVL